MGLNKSKYNKNHFVVKSKNDIKGYVKILNSTLLIAYKQSYIKAINDFYKYLTNVLDRQKYKWKPLSSEYKSWKEKHGLDTRMLIATGFYRDHIIVKIGERTAFVGLPNIIHKPSGLPLPTLAFIHEYGTKRRTEKGERWIPARPLWRPAISVFIRKWNKEHKKNVLVNVRKTLKKKKGA